MPPVYYMNGTRNDYSGDNRVAVIGAGRWGRNHVKKLAELLPAGALGIYEPEAANLNNATDLAEECKVYPNYEAVLSDPSVVAVVITAPAKLHGELTADALQSGKHVFVEKPLALDVSEGTALVETAEAKGLILMVGHILMYDPAVEYLRKVYQSGELGDLNYALLERAKLGTVRTVEDAIFSLASHDISVITYILDKHPETVSCSGATSLNQGIVDAAFIDLNYAGGSIAHIAASWLHPITVRRLVLVCSGKMALLDETTRPRLTIYEKGARMEGGEVVLFDEGAIHPQLEEVDLLEKELLIFLDCVTTGNTPPSDGRQALEVLKIMCAAQKSLTGRGTPVVMEDGG